MTKIIFIDIDGPLIPTRSYMLPKNIKPDNTFVMEFDQSAVSMLNFLAEIREWRFVIHSSWIRVWGPAATLSHCINQGLYKEFFAADPLCNENLHWRYDRVAEYVARHPEITDYVIIDDEPYKSTPEYEQVKGVEKHLLLVDFDEGFLHRNFRQIRDGNWKHNP